MSIDCRTRRVQDVRVLERDELLDALLPDALAVQATSPDVGPRTWSSRPLASKSMTGA